MKSYSGSALTQFNIDDGLAMRHDAPCWHRFWRVGLSNSLDCGQQVSYHRGQGMDFEEIRPYHRGDDQRHIDWSAVARTGKLYTKVFKQENQQSAWVMLTPSASMHFASTGRLKSVLACQAMSALMWSACQAQVAIGCMVLDGSYCLKPKQDHKQDIVDTCHHLATMHQQPFVDVSAEQQLESFNYFLSCKRPGDQILWITDYVDHHLYEQWLMSLSECHRIMIIFIYDLLESTCPPTGWYQYQSAGKVMHLDLASPQGRSQYLGRWQQRLQGLTTLKSQGIGVWPLATHAELVDQWVECREDLWTTVS